MQQIDLFNNSPKIDDVSIPGLKYIEGCIPPSREALLTQYIDQAAWRRDLQRRVQHYGYVYDYTARSVRQEDYLGPLPAWLSGISSALCQEGLFPSPPDQAIINEYLPGQGIAKHIDCVPCFGNTVASLSLGSACIMQFEHRQTQEKHEQVLEPGALIILQDAARYQWQHAIPARKSDIIHGIKTVRQRRLSITFRTVTL